MPVNLTADGINTIGLQVISDAGCILGIVTQPLQIILIFIEDELHGLGNRVHVKRTLVAVSQDGG